MKLANAVEYEHTIEATPIAITAGTNAFRFDSSTLSVDASISYLAKKDERLWSPMSPETTSQKINNAPSATSVLDVRAIPHPAFGTPLPRAGEGLGVWARRAALAIREMVRFALHSEMVAALSGDSLEL